MVEKIDIRRKLIVEDAIIEFFNEVSDYTTIVKTIVDNPNKGTNTERSYGVSERLAKTILEVRSGLPDGQFESLQQLCNIKGLGRDTESDLFYTFEQFLAEEVDEPIRVSDQICGNWLNEETGILLEIEEYELEDGILTLMPDNTYDQIQIFTEYDPDLDAFRLNGSSPGIASLLETESTYQSLYHKENFLLLNKVSEGILELSLAGNAYLFISEEYPGVPLPKTAQYQFNEIQAQLDEDEHKAKIDNNLADPNDLDGLPDWWTDEDTKKFLEDLGKRIAEEIEEKFDPKTQVKEKVLERLIEKEAAKLLAKKLSEREAKRTIARLLKEGKSLEQAEKIARRLQAKLEKEYLYKHPKYLSRFNPLRKLKRLKLLLKSPKKWLRGKIAKMFIKGLGKKVLAIPGLIDDLLTIGEALYRWYQAHKAWEGARESWKQSRELEKQLEEFRKSLTPEQRRRIEDLYRREKEFFEKTRKEHKEKARDRIDA